MPTPPAQRSSLCLFCTSAARRRPRSLPLLHHYQIAYRSSSSSQESFNKRDNLISYSIGRRPLRDNTRFNLSLVGSTNKTPAFVTIREKLAKLKKELSQPEFFETLQLTRESFDQQWLTFERSINQLVKQGSQELLDLAQQAGLRRRGGRVDKLGTRLRYLFYAQTCGGRFTKAELENQKALADLRYPAEWYPATREVPRVVHLHVGPTNSGKTYRALKRLEEADRGIYLGPLRLLAHEVYTRLNAKGKLCALVTGEEQRMPAGNPSMWSCTVEMAPLNSSFDVAVIDEIQMINHPERGWAWSQAFLGIKAKEIHLCGEARTVALMRELCVLVGDKVHVHNYERLTPLEVAPQSLRGNLDNLEKGDCVVAFSVLGIHALRKDIEKRTGRKCAIVYGSLPPETRAQQARLFNDPDNDYDFLVASDAIGMGLNLAIKRVILESTVKSDGEKLVPLQISDIKQIAGRAGRYRTAHQAITNDQSKTEPETARDPSIGLDDKEPEPIKYGEAPPVGLVTTLEQMDFGYLKMGMKQEPEPIKTAGLFPPSLITERFASYFPPGTPFSYIMLRLHEISNIHPRFHLCGLKDQLAIADAIHTIKGLSIADRIVICASPTNTRDTGEKDFLRSLAECIAENKAGELLSFPTLPLEVLDRPPSSDRSYLYSLEQLHKMVVTYLWLSYRFPNVFTTRALANYVKKIVEDSIEKTLMEFSWTEQARAAMKKKRQKAMRFMEQQEEDEEARANATDEGTQTIQVPQEVENVLHDTRSFNEKGSPPTDDEGKYPTEELEILGPTRLDVPGKQRQHHKKKFTRKNSEALKDRHPPTTSPDVEQSDTSPARI